MKKFTKSIISVILTLSMLLSLTVPVFAAEALPKTHSIYETNKGIVIDNKYYTYDEFNKLLDTAKEVKTENPKVQTRSIGALVAGSFAIPGVGAFVVTAAGIIIFNDQIIDAGTKLYTTIMQWFQDRKHIAYQKLVDSIPKKLRDGNTVDLGKFNKKVGSGSNVGLQENVTGQGWVIQKDHGGTNSHGGSTWKIKTKKQFEKGGKERTATLNKDGKVLRD